MDTNNTLIISPTKYTKDTNFFYVKQTCRQHLCVPSKSIPAENKFPLLIAVKGTALQACFT